MLEWAAVSFSRESSRPGDRPRLLLCRWILYHRASREACDYLNYYLYHCSQKLQPGRGNPQPLSAGGILGLAGVILRE